MRSVAAAAAAAAAASKPSNPLVAFEHKRFRVFPPFPCTFLLPLFWFELALLLSLAFC